MTYQPNQNYAQEPTPENMSEFIEYTLKQQA